MLGLNIRQKQTDALLKVLNLNPGGKGTAGAGPSAAANGGEVYKILILDKYSKDIIAPLVRLNELRKHGVTLHLMIEADRQPIPDVPAVYLVQPTNANIERIAADAAAGLYDSMYLNFTAALPSRLLENLAVAVVRSSSLARVGQVFDQYLSFIALEASLFSLGLPGAYLEMNDPSAKDFQIEAAVASIVDGLFSVCVTLGTLPVIRCPRGGAAEHVAGALDQRLRDALRGRGANLFSDTALGLGAALSRPVLCLFDRNFDLSSVLQHTWTYKPLVHDALGMKLNRVTLTPPEAGPGPSSAAAALAAKKMPSYDVDERDFFWESNGSQPFPKVAEDVETQLQRYKAAVEEINRRTVAGAAGATEGVYDPDDQLRRNTQNLMSAVSSLPELQEQKKVVDKHTNLATALLGHIKSRQLDQYYHVAEDLLVGKGDLPTVVRLLQGPKGTPADKQRLAAIYLLAQDGVPSDADFDALEGALRTCGIDTTALGYVRTLKRNNLTGSARGAGGADALGMASQGNLLDWADKTFGQGISQVTKSVKTLLAGGRQPPLTVAVEALVDAKAGSPEFESYAVFDPKAPAGKAGLERAKGPFREALVFVIGGGSYLEREKLLAWAARATPPRQLVYGATDIVAGEEFLAQLAELGRRSGAQ